MRKTIWIASAFLILAALGSPLASRADTITYTVNNTQGTFTVTGTVTTDAAIGTLSAADIVAWNLTLNASSPIVLNQTNSVLNLAGNALSATASQLTFNFTSGFNDHVQFIDPSSVSWWDVVSQPPFSGYEAIAEINGLAGEQFTYTTGSQVIATGGVVSTPEPSSIALMIIGIGLVAVTRKRLAPRMQQVN